MSADRTPWESLRHSGLLLGPAQVRIVEQDFAVPDLRESALINLRREILQLDADPARAHSARHRRPGFLISMPPQNNSKNTIIFMVIAGLMLLAYSFFVMQPQAERQKAARAAAEQQAATATVPGAAGSTPAAPVFV